MPKRTPEQEQEIEGILAEARLTTRMIRHHADAIEELSKNRMGLVMKLRDRGVTYVKIAAALEVSDQTVFKIIKTWNDQQADESAEAPAAADA